MDSSLIQLGHFRLRLPSLVIEEANVAITSARQEEAMKAKRGPYLKLSNELKAKIRKHASENGDSAAARHFSKVLGKELNRSTVHGLNKVYLEELSRKRKAGEDMTITSLPAKKRGRPSSDLELLDLLK